MPRLRLRHGKLDGDPSQRGGEVTITDNHTMRIICIRPLMRDPNNTDKWSVLKGLKEDEFYYLYDGYDITKIISILGKGLCLMICIIPKGMQQAKLRRNSEVAIF